MTNYRTVVPGMQDGGDETSINHSGARARADQSSHGSYSGHQSDNSGTRVPGMDGAAPNTYGEQPTGKPIMGFLVSVSKTDEGEYWVLRQGQNMIGSGANCNIVLNEASVSGVHAVLAIHRNPNDGNRISIGIMDRGSSNGTFVNGDYIGFNPCQCKNMDKIKIGNYELLLMVFDAVEFNMKKSAGFVPKGDFDYADRDMYTQNDGTRY